MTDSSFSNRRFSPKNTEDPHIGSLDLDGELESIYRIQKGDQTSLQQLFESTSPWIFNFVKRFVRDEQIAEEVTLDIYIQVWKSSKSYSISKGSVRAWIVNIARSRAIDRLRKEKQRKERSVEKIQDLEVETRYEKSDDGLAEEIQIALKKLPESQRIPVLLCYFRGLSHTEISVTLERPLGTVKTQIRLGLNKLRSFLQNPKEDRQIP